MLPILDIWTGGSVYQLLDFRRNMRNSLNIKYAIVGEFDEKIIKYVEKKVGDKLDPHDSLYKGDYWLFRKESPELNVELKMNVDPMHDPESDPKEEYYFDYENRDCDLLLDIDGDPETVKTFSSKVAENPNFRLILSENYTW